MFSDFLDKPYEYACFHYAYGYNSKIFYTLDFPARYMVPKKEL